jgi:hypothetical protein
MIRDVDRSEFLAAPGAFESCPCIALAAVASDTLDEAAALEGWNVLRSLFSGSGTRVGFRSFLALVQDTEVGARGAIALFSEQRTDHASWHFMAAPVSLSGSPLAALQEVEWRAHKNALAPEAPALNLVGVASAL